MKLSPYKFLSLAITILCAATASAFDGDWHGKLNLNGAELSIVFHIKLTPRVCTIDSPDQGTKGIPASITYCSGDTISIYSALIGASFNGRLSRHKITGTFKQMGHSFHLTLEQGEAASPERPQTPKPPYPYAESEVEITANDALLAATLFMPNEPKAAVVFISGSGAQNRNEEIHNHKPFLVLADRLARAGIASLRYDDRGTAQSTGNIATATTYTFCDDATAAIARLRELCPECPIGVIGHSEGGTIAFMLAAEGKIDFAISLAGMVQSGIDLIIEQNRDVLRAVGKNGTELESEIEKVKTLLYEEAKKSPWLSSFLELNPSGYIANIKCPLLALNGSLDTQVKPSLNLPIIRELQPTATIKEYPKLNHLFQHAKTGAVSEYATISETIAEEVITDIIDFVCSKF